MRARRAPGAEVDGQPPPRPAPPHGAAPRARALGLPPGELARVRSLRAARLPGGPSSPSAAALASVPAASARPACVPPGSPRAFPSAAAPEPPAAGPEKPGGGGRPLQSAQLRAWAAGTGPGEAVPQPPRGAAGEDETATSVVSASEVRQENWGGCGGGGGPSWATLTVWLQPSPPPAPYPTPRPRWPGLQ